MTDDTQAIEPIDLRELQRQAPAARMDALISHPQARAVVQQLAPFSLYHLIREIGVTDAIELVHLASPEQFQTFLDLDCWKRDRFSEAPLIEWLQIALEAEDDDFNAVLNNIDPEPLALMLKAHALVFMAEEDGEIPEEARNLDRSLETLDGVYYVAYDDNEDATRLLRSLLKRLYDKSRGLAWALMDAVLWELNSSMEETSYQARSSRLTELGFVDIDEALAIYAWRDPASLKAAAQTAKAVARPADGFLMPDLFSEPLLDSTFLSRAIRRAHQLIDQGELEGDMDGFAFALMILTNKAMATEAAELRDVEASRRVYARVRGGLQIALEHASSRDLDAAAHLVASTHPQQLFQVGNALTVGLARQARHLVGTPAVAERLTLTDETPYGLLAHADRLLVNGLLAPRPESHTPGTDYTEPFTELIQIERAAARLSQLAFKITAIFGILGIDRETIATAAYGDETTPSVEAITLETILNTALGHAALKNLGVAFAPMTIRALADLIEGPIKQSRADASGDGNDLMDVAEVLFLPKDMLDPTAMTIARIVTSKMVGHLIDELATINPDDLREGRIQPHHLGDTLLLTP